MTFVRAAAGHDRATPGRLRGRRSDLQGEHLAGLDGRTAAEDLRGVEVVQAAHLVVRAPLAPVLRGFLQDFIHGRDFSHKNRSFLAERTERSLGDPWRIATSVTPIVSFVKAAAAQIRDPQTPSWCSGILNTMKHVSGPVAATPNTGEAVRQLRAARSVSVRGLAARIGVSPATISAIENGKTGISVQRLHQIATALAVPAAALVEDPATPGQPRNAGPSSVELAIGKLARVRSLADRPCASRGDQGVRRDRLPRGKHAVDRAVRQHERAGRVSPLPQQTGLAGKDPRHHDDGPPLAAAARTRRRKQSDPEGRATWSKRWPSSIPGEATCPSSAPVRCAASNPTTTAG